MGVCCVQASDNPSSYIGGGPSGGGTGVVSFTGGGKATGASLALSIPGGASSMLITKPNLICVCLPSQLALMKPTKHTFSPAGFQAQNWAVLQPKQPIGFSKLQNLSHKAHTAQTEHACTHACTHSQPHCSTIITCCSTQSEQHAVAPQVLAPSSHRHKPQHTDSHTATRSPSMQATHTTQTPPSSTSTSARCTIRLVLTARHSPGRPTNSSTHAAHHLKPEPWCRLRVTSRPAADHTGRRRTRTRTG